MPQDDAILLKEPGLYCFLFRCRMPEAEPFMEWVVETILPRKARKLTSVIEELFLRRTHLQCSLMICRIAITKCKSSNMKTWHYKHKKMCIRLSYKNVETPSPISKSVMFLMQNIPVKTTLSSLYGNVQSLSMISFMICHIMSRGYIDVNGMSNQDDLINIFLSMKSL